MAYGKSIELFLVNGTADSLITAELSNWNGKAIKIPRIEVSACNRDDIKQAGVYFLFCKEDVHLIVSDFELLTFLLFVVIRLPPNLFIMIIRQYITDNIKHWH